VLESRSVDEDAVVRRRRECALCLRRFTTYERVDELPLVVVKRDGRREAFDRRKVLVGLIKACEKRPVSTRALESLAEEVERELRERGEPEVESTTIGELVMQRLSQLDPVAYVRFASVYRQFTDVQHFQSELERLLQESRRGRGWSTGGANPSEDIR
jgi:transcriptional repressor NrdR